jgi:hypothetical protein
MRWTGETQLRGVARRRAWLVLLILVFGVFLAFDWAATTPESALTPEAGGPVPGVSAVTQASNRRDGMVNEASGQSAGQRHSGREWGHVTTKTKDLQTETNPLDLLVDGPGFVRFLGFTAISLGFAVVVLVFFWSYRSNLRQ